MRDTLHAGIAATGVGFLRAARVVTIILLTASLAGCAVTNTERLLAEDEQGCGGSSYKPGTNLFAKCLQDHNFMRMPPTR